jgi:heme-degrading monooxygenase HmoA
MTPTDKDRDAITQITIVEPEAGKQDEALALMAERARFMSSQPGFISIDLFRSLDGKRIINCLRWQNQALLQSAHHSPEFRKEWNRFDQMTGSIDPHLYEVAQSLEARP